MPLTEPVLSGPGAGRTVTSGHGSGAELKLAGEQSDGDWAVVESHVRAGDEAGSYAALPKNLPHALTVRGDEARLLITLEPAGTEYFLVPRDDSDADPAKFGLIIHQAASAM